VFWSKIWFFLVALGAAAAFTIALVLPRPAERTLVHEEQQRLAVACGVIGILLADDAHKRVEVTGAFARRAEIGDALEQASAVEKLDDARMKQVREVGKKVMEAIEGERKPDFAILVDRRGRAVARVQLDENDYGDVVSGRPLIDDALAGYQRDDLWTQNGTMYFVSAAPVIKRDAYVGAVVLGHYVTTDLAKKLVKGLNVDVGFFLGPDDVAGSYHSTFDHGAMQDAVKKLSGGDLSRDCEANSPLALHAGNDDYTAIVARLPGEAALKQAYYSVYIKRPEGLGFTSTLKVVQQQDLSFRNFPWLVVGGGFLLVLVLGIGLMFVESDRPLRRLTADAVRLGKGEKERLSEEQHGGKFGSIARSVNIHIDKIAREAKTAKKDMDQLLGPAPEGSLGTIDLLATALPSVRPGGAAPSASPPPSDFRFGGPAAPPVQPPPQPPSRMRKAQTAPGVAVPATPAIEAPPPPVPIQMRQPPPAALDDDILGPPGAPPQQSDSQSTPIRMSGPMAALPATPASSSSGPIVVDPYFKQIFDQFVVVKKSCNEPTASLTYGKFAEKLSKNRDDLMAKTGCREVRFTVYVKDGKAALKATPVKDE
jgi:hypothetical protein